MRLDKFLTHTGTLTRRQAAAAAKAGKLSVNGTPVLRCDIHIDPEHDQVAYMDQHIAYQKYTYIMLNKPAGVLSATNDPKQKTVIDLLPEPLQRLQLFPCGRLDKDTLGLLILTNDGPAAHRQLSPKTHAEKEYAFRCKKPFSQIQKIEKGVCLADGYQTLPCKIRMADSFSGVITLTEGKYHQIKRMFEALDQSNCLLGTNKIRRYCTGPRTAQRGLSPAEAGRADSVCRRLKAFAGCRPYLLYTDIPPRSCYCPLPNGRHSGSLFIKKLCGFLKGIYPLVALVGPIVSHIVSHQVYA